MKKMSIIRFRPKNGCMDEFIEASLKFSKDRGTAVPPTHFLMKSGEEVIAVVIRDSDTLNESMSGGVDWLDTQRHLLEEFNEVDRHTIPLTGDLIEYK